ncbi:MAG: lipid-A-disaccharide synthase [Nitrospirae bacterium]|nr:lipid-A-disaccharide synthase [Nitrospirota bacterium]
MLKKVMIISGESSGELYGAFLAKALIAENPGINIVGVGGERMRSAGVRLVAGISSSFGITEAVKTYIELRETFKKVISTLKSFKPEVLVLIDYPDFNIKVAKKAKEFGIKILYYVSPQVWAWRMGRIKVIGRFVDRMALILPFEEEIYKRAGIPCEFVGHPIMDEIREVMNELGVRSWEFGADLQNNEIKSKVKEELGLIPDKPVMALMPGSRFHEIEKLLPVMSEVIDAVKERYPDYQFVIPIAPNLGDTVLSTINKVAPRSSFITRNSIKALLASDIAVIASGTSALQAALLCVPIVVVYKLSPLTYFIGKLIVKVKHISLVNILLDYLEGQGSVVKGRGKFFHSLRIKELLQKEAHKENIIMELNKIMDDVDYRNEMVSQMKRVRALFLEKEASLRLAEMAEGLGVQAGV